MARRPVARLKAAVVLVCLLLGGTSARGGEQLEIEAPPELAAEAARLRELAAVDLGSFRALLGWDERLGPITVVLATEESAIGRHMPRWIAGFARGEEGLIVLFPSRVPLYPYSSLAELLRHEIAHVMIDRAAGGAQIPRWFHEGLAIVAEGGWRVSDRSRLAMAVLRAGKPDLEEVNGLFSAGEPRVSWAYAVSGAFVRDIVRRHDEGAVARIFAQLRRGADFDTSFATAVGASPGAELGDFWRRSRIWYRWLPVLTSSTVLWIAVTLLALVAIRRRRRRDQEMLDRWDEEEARSLAATIGPDETVH